MSGVRQQRPIRCESCGTEGRVKLGMPLIGGRRETRDFDCDGCGAPVRVEAQRAIMHVEWGADSPPPAEPLWQSGSPRPMELE